jgi:hypothetical protein
MPRGLAFVAAAALLAAAGAAVAAPLFHVPPVEVPPGEPVMLTAGLSSDVAARALEGLLVVDPSGRAATFPMQLAGDRLVGEIPAEFVAASAIEYRLVVVLADGEELSAPPGEGTAFRVPVTSGAALSGGVEIVSPLPGAVVEFEERLELAGVFDPPLDAPWEALVLLDGIDVTDRVLVTPDLFVSEPLDAPGPGVHTVTVSVLTPTGRAEGAASFVVPGTAGEGPGAVLERFALHGRLEIGWAAAFAETTAAESLDVYLPYEETSMPSMSYYASGGTGVLSVVTWAAFDPVYDDRVTGAIRVDGERMSFEVGDVFPELTESSMQWTAGVGGHFAARLGLTETKVVALRLSEADTVAGFGWYSRFAVGASERVTLGNATDVTLAYVRSFDREESVPEENRIDDPLANDVAAALVRHVRGGMRAEAEVAWSTSSGFVEEEGLAIRAELAYERDYRNRVALTYSRNDTGYYAAASIATEPGTEGLEAEFAWEGPAAVRWSGSVGAFRTQGSSSGVDADAAEWRAALRVDDDRDVAGGRVSTYALFRYDEVPYESAPYRQLYGAAGATYRASRWSASLRGSFSRTDTPDVRYHPGLSLDVRGDLVPGSWSARAAVRWSGDRGDDEDADRVTTDLESQWTVGEVDLTVEWQRVDRDDRVEQEQGYTENVLRGTVGFSF